MLNFSLRCSTPLICAKDNDCNCVGGKTMSFKEDIIVPFQETEIH